MRWYKDRPDEGDLIVVTISDVDKNSAYADLDEYEDVSGLIHISEASRSWVEDLTREIDEGEKTVAQVIDVDDDTITLSLKRVNDNNKREAMSRWNKEQKAEKFVEDLHEELDMDKDEIFEEVVFPMQREVGSAFHGFEISTAEEDRLKEFLDEDVVEAVQEVAKKNIDLKQEKFEGEIELEFTSENGIQKIKDSLEDLGEGVEVKYVSAPDYSITSWGRTQELAKKRMDEAVEKIRSKADELDGRFEFSRA
ncbi:S1 RNA-binding domain-containing protein [Candidatus Nanohalobium constans]|uniref:Translation initiation factor IF-2 subunit alpha n=1 Tax=Candidatus Nanohalobium constans TaxID=2565781 RepID=A0A5Q0UF52_9ARCH|nr:S1 RNA-binding domain-containing protein [Candidatus Nanohalobium constans]QGA80188.1 translation initiation factor IF-2 subunit alpha [Candidatus Nanohalobium constans]